MIHGQKYAAPFPEFKSPIKGLQSIIREKVGSRIPTMETHSWDSLKGIALKRVSMDDQLSLSIRKNVPLRKLEKLITPTTINGKNLNPLSEAIRKGK